MDSKHRQDLEENDLFAFLANFKAWWNRYGTVLLAGILMVVLAFILVRYFQGRSVRQHEEAWSGVNGMATTPDAFVALAKGSSDPNFQARAYLAAGDKYIQKAAEPVASALGDPSRKSEQDEALKSAKEIYEQVAGISGASPVFKLNAQLGLGAVAEGQRNWAAAQDQYRQITNAPEAQAYPMIVARAEARRKMLDRVAVPVAFAPVLERTLNPWLSPTTWPSTMPSLPAEIGLPSLPPVPGITPGSAPTTKPATP
jgi:hypothetical protein